jgi:hypothetical protein
VQRGREHGRHAAKNFRLVALDQLPDVAHRGLVAPARGREDDDCAAARERREPLRERAADVIKRQSKQDFSPRLRAQDQVADPSLVDLVAVRMPHKLGRAGRAAGVEVRGDVVGGNAAPARKPVGRILREQRVVAMDAVLLVARAVHLQDRFQARQLAPHALDFLPDVGAGRRRERHEYFRSGRAQDFRDLPRFEQRIHRVRDPGGFRAIEREEALRQQRQHEADDVARPDAEIRQQVRRLRDFGDELPVADRQRRLVRLAALQEVNRRRQRVVRSADLQRFVCALRSDALGIRRRLECAQFFVGPQLRKLRADDAVQKVCSFHFRPNSGA